MTSTSTTTTSSNTTTGNSGIGSKIKGAAQIVHGAGENIRGTILGGVDTAVHKDSSANDEIARKGREQHATGVSNLKGRPLAAQYAHPADATAYGGNNTGGIGPGAQQTTDLQTAANGSPSDPHAGGPGAGTNITGTAEYSNAQQGYDATNSVNQPTGLNNARAPGATQGDGRTGVDTTGAGLYPDGQQGYGTANQLGSLNTNQGPGHSTQGYGYGAGTETRDSYANDQQGYGAD
ncbi:hypothetical protein DFH07DRAFT_943186, partial [Mycena maculata]